MNDPGYPVMILSSGPAGRVLEHTARGLAVPCSRALDIPSARDLLPAEGPALVVADAGLGALELRDHDRIDVALMGPAAADAIERAFHDGVVDWLQDAADPIQVTRLLESHRQRVASRHDQNRLLDTLARTLCHHLQPGRAVQGEMAQVVLHEVRNALAALELNVGALGVLVGGQASSEVCETLTDLEQLTTHLGHLVGSGRTLLGTDESAGDVARAIHTAVTMTTTRSQVTLTSSVEEGIGRVALPTHQLAQILLNTTLNAVHAGARRIRIDAVRLPDRAQISVVDDGGGMTRDQLGQALSPGYTTRATGTGLGLAICKEIVESAGGSISLASGTGRGTTVTVEVPLRTV